MALIIEDGTGPAGAESYALVAAFKVYRLANYAVTDPVTDEAIEQTLRRSTRFIDGKYRSRFLGYRTYGYAQALEWPRTGVVLTDPGLVGSWFPHDYVPGYGLLSATVIPTQLKNAVFEAAIRELASPGSLTPDRTPSKQVLQQTVGPISTTYANVPTVRPVVTIIDELLAPLLLSRSILSGSLERA